MKDLEKTLDLDSFGQVQFETSQKPTSGTSASTADTSQRHSQETSAPLTETSQGKGKDTSTPATEQSTMSKQPETSQKQAQTQAHPTQINMGEPPILHIPLNEERNKKRDREVATPTSGPLDQPGAKRHKLNPHSEEEFFEDTTKSQRKEGADSQHTFPAGGTPSSSQRQELERQQSAKVSSFRPPGNENLDIKKKFEEIKAKNEPLRA